MRLYWAASVGKFFGCLAVWCAGRGGTGRDGAGRSGARKAGRGGRGDFHASDSGAHQYNISCAVFEKHSNIQEAYVASNARCTRERGGGVTLVRLGLFERRITVSASEGHGIHE